VQPLVEFGAQGNGTIQVQVLVAIDAKGKVVKVTPVGPIADVRLVAAAIKTAQFWEFEPARLNGQAIASEMTLIFRF
jgi:TonB family protein